MVGLATLSANGDFYTAPVVSETSTTLVWQRTKKSFEQLGVVATSCALEQNGILGLGIYAWKSVSAGETTWVYGEYTGTYERFFTKAENAEEVAMKLAGNSLYVLMMPDRNRLLLLLLPVALILLLLLPTCPSTAVASTVPPFYYYCFYRPALGWASTVPPFYRPGLNWAGLG